MRSIVSQPFSILASPVAIGQAQFAGNKLLVFGLALLFSGALIVLLRTTLLGKGVRALMQSQVGAQLVGIDTHRLHPLMFGIGLGLSGVAGSLLSMAYTISPSMGEPYTVTALIVITLGGFGSMSGALAGGLLLGVIEAFGLAVLAFAGRSLSAVWLLSDARFGFKDWTPAISAKLFFHSRENRNFSRLCRNSQHVVTFTWETPLPRMRTLRHSHTATVLPSGKVLIAGGYDDNIQTTAQAWIYQ